MIANVAKAVLDLLFPPLCIGCRAPVGEAGFCAACWSGISFLDGPGCACCGLPFPVALEGEQSLRRLPGPAARLRQRPRHPGL